jgi:hypothetical protein
MVRGSKPGVGEIFHTRPNCSWGPASLLSHGYRFYFWGLKRPGRGVVHLPYLTPRLKKENSYTCTFFSGFSRHFLGWNLLYFYGEVKENFTVNGATPLFHHSPSLYAESILHWNGGVQREFGGLNPHPNFRSPSNVVANTTPFWKLFKSSKFRTTTPQDFRKQCSKFLKPGSQLFYIRSKKQTGFRHK